MARIRRPRMHGLQLVLVCAVIVIAACKITLVCVQPLVTGSIAESLEDLRHEVAPLTFESPSRSKAIDDYTEFYAIETNGLRHVIGTFMSGTNTIVAQFFIPSECKGTVLVMHGCYDHAGSWRHVIKDLTGRGYAVALYDAPGHGLSSGARADIEDFDDYVTALRDFLVISDEHAPKPHHLVGHSMGGAIALDYVLTSEGAVTNIDNVVLIAPLVRSDLWDLSKAGHSVAENVIVSVPRAFRKNSSDKDYMEFVKNDPLQCRVVPLTWVTAMYQWNERLENYSPSVKEVTIIQGTDDTTVDWEYNLEFLKKKLTTANVVTITNGGHQLMNEAGPIRDRTLEEIRKAIALSPDVTE